MRGMTKKEVHLLVGQVVLPTKQLHVQQCLPALLVPDLGSAAHASGNLNCAFRPQTHTGHTVQTCNLQTNLSNGKRPSPPTKCDKARFAARRRCPAHPGHSARQHPLSLQLNTALVRGAASEEESTNLSHSTASMEARFVALGCGRSQRSCCQSGEMEASGVQGHK